MHTKVFIISYVYYDKFDPCVYSDLPLTQTCTFARLVKYFHAGTLQSCRALRILPIPIERVRYAC